MVLQHLWKRKNLNFPIKSKKEKKGYRQTAGYCRLPKNTRRHRQVRKGAKKSAAAGLKAKAEAIIQILHENPFQPPPAFEKLVGDLRNGPFPEEQRGKGEKIMRSICIFLGSNPGADQVYAWAAEEMGRELSAIMPP